MFKRFCCAALAAAMLLTAGCAGKEAEKKAAEELKAKVSQSFQTTAKLNYQGLETQMTIYKKPMNCAIVTFQSPDSLKDMKMTFYPDKVALHYKELSFDFVPDSVPGQAASKLVLSALNTALNDDGVTVEQKDGQLLIKGQLPEGAFTLVVDGKNGNILKLSIPQSGLELEVLNFKILE